MQTKEQIQTEIQNLKNKHEILRNWRQEIETEYIYHEQWMTDPLFKYIFHASVTIVNQLTELRNILNENKDSP